MAPPLQLALTFKIQTPGMLSETVFWRKVTTPSSMPYLRLRQIIDYMSLIGLCYKHLQILVYFYSFKLYLGLQ